MISRSFPSECFSPSETKAFADYYGDPRSVGIIEILEFVNMYDPDIVKLDRQLISDIDKEPEKQENVKKYLAEFHSRGMLVVAEGIEHKEEFDRPVLQHSYQCLQFTVIITCH